MNPSMPLENQLLATKFYVPMASGTLISRPRLTTLLNESLQYPLTLVSAAAGFGKTTLLSTWSQSLPAGNPRIAWVSLDEEDNEPRLFWTYVLTALGRQEPERFTPLLTHLQSPQAPPLKYLLVALINLLMESTEHFLLILDDYHVITEQEVHTTLAYLIEHLPAHLHIIVATRTDPSLPLPLLRSRGQALEIRTDQLRCTSEETRTFFNEVMSIQLPEQIIQKIGTRMEGWLVGLQLLSLSLSEQAAPLNLPEQVSGDQRYILDYLTDEVLQRQPQEIQTFLLSTSILELLNASLCDAIMEQHGSQQMLQRLEKANLFIVSLDSKRQWYRYHALFAEALRSRLERDHTDLVLTLHHRASIWYAEHNQTTQAILHALRANEWHWAADLIERKHLSLTLHTWGASEHELTLLQHWLEQLPSEIMGSRPRLCVASTLLLWQVAPHPMLHAWLDTAEAKLAVSLTAQIHEDASRTMLTPEMQQEKEDLLGKVTVIRAFLQSYGKDGQSAVLLCQRALSMLSAQNLIGRTHTAGIQLVAYYTSSENDAVAAIQSGVQAISLAQATKQPTFAIRYIGTTALFMLGTGRLYETQRLIQQAKLQETQQVEQIPPEMGWPAIIQAELQREWNQLDAAHTLAQEAISLYKQTSSMSWLVLLLCEYSVLVRIHLSRRELDAARSALQQVERIGMSMNQPSYSFASSFFTTIDQVKLWLACGELDRATCWAEELDLGERHWTPFAHEREEVARVRVLLATGQPDLALQRLEPVLQRATTGKRWGHVIEVRLLQALAHQMYQQEIQALDALAEAVRLAEPEGYIRSFVDEGAPMEALLNQLRKPDRKNGPNPYLDTLLTAFQQESMVYAQAGEPTKVQPLPEPLSERELQVLQLLARGESNLEIAQELVIVVDTVKRHVSHIFSKLGVQNRVQAVRQARELGLLDKEG